MYPMGMKRLPIAILLPISLTIPAHAADLILKDAPVQVHFSPRAEGKKPSCRPSAKPGPRSWCRPTVFTSAPIAEALKKAHGWGVKVNALLDGNGRMGRLLTLLLLYQEWAGGKTKSPLRRSASGDP